jgi:hypothetical protein
MKAIHRAQEHEFEAQFGLPEQLPAGEKLLWQGQPLPGLVARRVFHLPLIAGYFAAMALWGVASAVAEGAPFIDALISLRWPLFFAAVALAIIGYLARLTAQTTAYTITDKRVVMRIGIVLTVTYNLPLRCIDAAHLLPLKRGQGEIALALRGDTRIAWLHLWPHARPWLLKQPQPMLRGLGDAQAVSDLLARAWTLANALPANTQPAAQAQRIDMRTPTLAGGHAD